MNNARGRYNTKQRRLILSFLEESAGSHVSAEAIAKSLNGQVGLTTIYRFLDELTKGGSVVKYDTPESSSGACYRYIGNEDRDMGCYHFLCTDCGQMLHINCEKLEDFSSHVQKDHGLSLDLHKTVLFGSCGECMSEKPKASKVRSKRREGSNAE